MKRVFKNIVVSVTLAVAVTSLVILLGSCDGETTHKFIIKNDGGICKIVDESDNLDITVHPGDWVVWENQYGSDVELIFPPATTRLFGVQKATSYSSGDQLKLQIREDADTGSTFKYDTNCGTTLPGPGIIVCPPGQPSC